MPFVLNQKFVSWYNRWADARDELTSVGFLASQRFGRKAVQEMKNLAYRRGVFYSESEMHFSEEFHHFVRSAGRGFATSYEIVFENRSFQAKFVAFGAGPARASSRNPLRYGGSLAARPHPEVIRWALQKLTPNYREAGRIAFSIANFGQQLSNRSLLRNLPPRGEKGYDILLDMEETGGFDRLMQEFSEDLGRAFKREMLRF